MKDAVFRMLITACLLIGCFKGMSGQSKEQTPYTTTDFQIGLERLGYNHFYHVITNLHGIFAPI